LQPRATLPSLAPSAPAIAAKPASPAIVAPSHLQPAGEQEEFAWDEPSPWPNIQRRRRFKFVRFLAAELILLIFLGVAVNLALSHRLLDDSVALIAKISTITIAVLVAVMPILFYGLPETLPRR
jgi:hypothetical protein